MDREHLRSKTKAIAGLIVDEFIMCGSISDASASVEDLQAPEDLLPELTKHMILAALDKPDKERVAVAGLLSSLCVRGALQTRDVEAGLELVLRRMGDVVLDVPKAAEYISELMAHLVEDKTVPEGLVESVGALAGAELGGRIAEGVRGQLRLPLAVTVLKGQARSVVQEYFVSGDLEEALRRFEELQAGRGGHVVVKVLIVSAAERKSRECEMASVLLSALTKLYGSEHFFEGFIRILRGVDDLALDVPAAVSILTNFIARAIVDDVLPPCFFSLVPGKLVTAGRGRDICHGVRALLEVHGEQPDHARVGVRGEADDGGAAGERGAAGG